VQALGGAKNHLVVMPDADMPKTVEAIIGSAFGAAGERCLAGSVLVPVGDAAGPLLDLLVERTKRLNVGDGSAQGVEMGPLVTRDHCQRVEGYVEKGVAEGAVPLVDGRASKPKSEGFFLGPTIFDRVTPEMTIARDERERRSRRPNGVLPIRRVEEFVLRRPPRPRQGRDRLLHRAKGHHEPLVLTACRRMRLRLSRSGRRC
jgi:hypothetical protein